MFCCLTASTARALLRMANAEFGIQDAAYDSEGTWMDGRGRLDCFMKRDAKDKAKIFICMHLIEGRSKTYEEKYQKYHI